MHAYYVLSMQSERSHPQLFWGGGIFVKNTLIYRKYLCLEKKQQEKPLKKQSTVGIYRILYWMYGGKE
jgi:hypothetical protein